MLGIAMGLIAAGFGMAAIFLGATDAKWKKVKEMFKWTSMVLAGIATVIRLVGILNLHGEDFVLLTLLFLAFGFYCFVLGDID